MLAKNMTPQAMRTYYETGGRISTMMAVTSKSYESIVRSLREAGTELVTGGHR